MRQAGNAPRSTKNLARAELSPAQEAVHIARRKRVWVDIEAGNSGTDSSTIRPTRGHPPGFASSLAKTTGETKQVVNRKIARVDALGADIDRIVGTSLERCIEMDALAKMPATERERGEGG